LTETGIATDLETLNGFLRGELSAVETYTKILKEFDAPDVISALQAIRDAHDRAARILCDHIAWCGGMSALGVRPSGEFAGLVGGSVRLLGPDAVLVALREGERDLVAQYEAARDLSLDCLRPIRTELLPLCRGHIERLEVVRASR
jgi:hypothetical protein